MTASAITPGQIEKAVAFHGHWCPGLALGLRAAELALNEVGHAGDEDIVAVVETDMCAVDAIQFLTGCTFGKGNLLYLDHGKAAFSFYRRKDGKAVRVLARPGAYGDLRREMEPLHKKMLAGELSEEEQQRLQEIRGRICDAIMQAPLEELFTLTPVTRPAPPKARILKSLTCDACGEATMETRTRRFDEKILCIPCFEAVEKRI
jgi:formylmethanofuran dehydrogenase subunit E